MGGRQVFLCVLLALSAPVIAQPQVGDCAIFREGGSGWVLKAPTWWLKGTIASVTPVRRPAAVCPEVGKPQREYTREDWARVAAASPCVDKASEVREIETLRLGFVVDSWETPWSYQHGTTRWLFRGHFLLTPLKKEEVIEMDASWLESCEADA